MTKSTGVRRRRGTGSIGAGGVILSIGGGKQRSEHILTAESAMGKPLPKGAVVHHFDLDNKNNSNENLVVCTQSYHMEIHRRQRANDACGHPDWRKCPICKEYDDPTKMKKNGLSYRHAACIAEYNKRYLAS